MNLRKTQSACELVADPNKRVQATLATAKISAAFPTGLSQPALRALAGAGYTNLEQLANVSDTALLALHGMGPKALSILRSVRTSVKKLPTQQGKH